jgi:hypothetical protein
MAMDKQLHDRIKAMAAELRQEIYGPTGAPKWGTKFTEIEDAGVELGDALARELIGQGLEAQATEARSASALACTVCGRDGQQDDVEPRIVQTRRGDAQWQEPKGLCKHCRKAFFPAVASLGD